MLYKKSHPFVALFTLLIFFVIIILDSSKGFNITIKTATPFLLLPMLLAFAVFGSTTKSAFLGLLLGACADSVANGSYCFNTIILLIIGTAACLCANNLFNKNIKATVVLSFVFSVIYYFAQWITFHAIGYTSKAALEYLFSYSFPSAIYTSLFIIPFYLIFRHFDKISQSI